MTDGGAGTALRHELARKAIHLTSVVVPVAYALGTSRDTLLALLCVAGVVSAIVEIARRRSVRARETFVRLFGTMLRAHEHDALAGATWMLVAYVGAVLIFPPRVAIAAMCAVALGDAAAAIVGRTASVARARRLGAPHEGKTFAGSAACATISAIAAYGIAGLGAPIAVISGVCASIAERWDIAHIDDNVRVALAAGCSAWASDVLVHALAHI